MNDVYLIKVATDDYEVLYVNGKRRFADHRLDLSTILESLIGYQVLNYDSYYIGIEIVEDKYGWGLPDDFYVFDEGDLTK